MQICLDEACPLAQNRLDLAETAKHSAQRMSEPRGFDFVPEACSAYHVGNPKLRYDSEDKKTSTNSQSSWTAISQATQSREGARRDW